jgi:hypothetical protein
MKVMSLPAAKSSSWTLTTPRLLVAIVFIAIFTMAVRVPADTDTWWHLRSGQYIVENQTIPMTDPFSHTKAGQLWIDHGWLAQVFWYGLYALGGWAALALALAGLVTVSFWFVWKQIEGNIFVGAFSMILGAIVSSVVWTARPQMISFVFTAIIAYWLARFKRQNGRLLPWVPLLMLVWVNVHGGFAIGFMLMLAYLMGEAVNNLTKHQDDPVVGWSQLKHLLLVMVISLAVVVVNPHTWRMWLYPFQTVGIGALRDFIQEWQSPDFHLPHVQPFVLMLLLVIAGLARSGRDADWTDLALVAMWTAWALFADSGSLRRCGLDTPVANVGLQAHSVFYGCTNCPADGQAQLGAVRINYRSSPHQDLHSADPHSQPQSRAGQPALRRRRVFAPPRSSRPAV